MLQQPILAFDIETIPDVDLLRKLNNLPDTLADTKVVDISKRLLRQKKGTDFFPHHLQRVVAIACVLRTKDTYKIFSLPDKSPYTSECDAISLFFKIIDKYQPTLVSWNGGGFDLPVMHYRALKHKLQAPTYWATEGQSKWNNYTSRYHKRHTDLMDILAMYQPRAWVGLDEAAQLCGLPGKIGIGGSNIWQAWQDNAIDDIRRYCEVDSLITYLLYLRYLNLTTDIDESTEIPLLRKYLENSETTDWSEFLSAWKST